MLSFHSHSPSDSDVGTELPDGIDNVCGQLLSPPLSPPSLADTISTVTQATTPRRDLNDTVSFSGFDDLVSEGSYTPSVHPGTDCSFSSDVSSTHRAYKHRPTLAKGGSTPHSQKGTYCGHRCGGRCTGATRCNSTTFSSGCLPAPITHPPVNVLIRHPLTAKHCLFPTTGSW